jgi:hypothetical protein
MESFFDGWDDDRMWWRKDIQLNVRRAGRGFSDFDRSLHMHASSQLGMWKSIRATQFCLSALAEAILHSPNAPFVSPSPTSIPFIVARSDFQEAEIRGFCEFS